MLLAAPKGVPTSAYIDSVFGPAAMPAQVQRPKTADAAQRTTTAPLREARAAEARPRTPARTSSAIPAAARRPAAPSSRPSLSAQLASIGGAAAAVTTDIRRTHGLAASGLPGEAPLLRVPALSFAVGALGCRFPSPVSFFADRATYCFNHPHEATQITMVMFYNDMRDLALSLPRQDLRFRVPNPLQHFSQDFDHNDRRHCVSICFASAVDCAAVAKILPVAVKPFRIA